MGPKLSVAGVILALAGSCLDSAALQVARKPDSAPAKKSAPSAQSRSQAAKKPTQAQKTVPQTLQDLFDRGQKAEKSGDLIRAESEYRQALGIALEELGSVYQALDDLDGAADAYRAATEARANSENALMGLGVVYLRKAEHEKGIEAVKLLIAQQRVNPAARTLLGKLYMAQDHLDAAVQELEEAQKWDPDDQDTKLTLAAAFLRQKRPERTEQLFAGMVKQLGDSAPLRIYFGVIYFENGYIPNAVEQLRRAAAIDPNYPRVHYYLGLAYVGQEGNREYGDGIKEFREELARRPDDYLANYMIGLVYMQDRQYVEATQVLTKAVELQPDKPDPRLYLGQALFLSGRQDEAVPHLLKAIELTPDPSRNRYQISKAHYLLSQYYNRKGNVEEATKQSEITESYKKKVYVLDQQNLKTYLGGMGGPNDLKAEASNATPSVLSSKKDLKPGEREELQTTEKFLLRAASNAYNQLGLLRARQSDFARAAQLLGRAARWGPDIPDVYFNFGLASLKAQNYGEAAAAFEKDREKQPERGELPLLLAMSYFYDEQYRKAGPLLSAVVSGGNSDPQVVFALGLCHAIAGDRKAGVSILRDLAAKYPSAADIHVGLGRALALDADFAGAQAEFAKALELDPKLPGAHYQRGLALIRDSKNAEAAEEFRQELVLNPSHTKAAFHLGYCLASLDKQDEAVEYLSRAIQLDPSYSEAHYELGKALLKQDKAKESIEALKRAVETGGDRSYVQYQLAQAFRKAGDMEAAQAAIARYRDLKAKEQAARAAPRQEGGTQATRNP